MINIEEIKDGLYDFMDALCAHQNLVFPIQWAEDNQNKSQVPRIELRILSLPGEGSPILLEPDETGLSDIVHESLLVLRVIASGNNSLAFCTLFKMASYTEEIIETLRDDTGLSILKSTDPSNISGFNDQLVEERWSIDVTFTFAYDLTEVDVGLIEHVDLTGELEHPDKTLVTIPLFTIDKPIPN